MLLVFAASLQVRFGSERSLGQGKKPGRKPQGRSRQVADSRYFAKSRGG
jgi:hypothetical protein